MRFEESVLSSVNSVAVSDSAMIRERISNSVRSEDSTLLSVNDFVSVAFTMSIEAPPPPPPLTVTPPVVRVITAPPDSSLTGALRVWM
ncbi:hypothetical protein NXY01_22260 [Bacteroides fragilis]|nr:hypothetical protein NXY01_22260 [Bacteroides fragilis]